MVDIPLGNSLRMDFKYKHYSFSQKPEHGGEGRGRGLDFWLGLPFLLFLVFLNIRSVDRLTQFIDYRVGGRGFKPRPDQHSGSLNN